MRTILLAFGSTSLFFATSFATDQTGDLIANSGDCEDPLLQSPTPLQIMGAASGALSNKRSPLHQREIALQNLMKLRSTLVRNGTRASEIRADVLEGEIFDIIFDNFSKVCLLSDMPATPDLLSQISGPRITKLLDLYENLMKNPDDIEVAATDSERYRIRLVLDSLLLEVGKINGWHELNFDRPVSDQASNWFLRYFDQRKNGPRLSESRVLITGRDALASQIKWDNPFAHYPNTRKALEALEDRLGFEINRELDQLFDTRRPTQSFLEFFETTRTVWSKILGVDRTPELLPDIPHSMRDQSDFRTLYFLNTGSKFLLSYRALMMKRLQPIFRVYFKDQWQESPFYKMISEDPDRMLGHFAWAWQIQDTDTVNRQFLKDAFEAIAPMIRGILVYKMLIARLSIYWTPVKSGLHPPDNNFYLRENEFREFVQSREAKLGGLLMTLESTVEDWMPIYKTLLILQKK
jgi:hypothetical protein